MFRPGLGVLTAHVIFLVLLVAGWYFDKLYGRRLAIWTVLWTAGYIAAGFFAQGPLLFGAYVAILDIILVMKVFGRDITIRW
jgi:hypothetical protein